MNKKSNYKNKSQVKKSKGCSFDLTNEEKNKIYNEVYDVPENSTKFHRRSISHNLTKDQTRAIRKAICKAEILKRYENINSLLQPKLFSKKNTQIKKWSTPKRNKYFKEKLKHPLLPESKVDDDAFKDILCEFLKNTYMKDKYFDRIIDDRKKEEELLSLNTISKCSQKRKLPILSNNKEFGTEFSLENNSDIVVFPTFKKKKKY